MNRVRSLTVSDPGFLLSKDYLSLIWSSHLNNLLCRLRFGSISSGTAFRNSEFQRNRVSAPLCPLTPPPFPSHTLPPHPPLNNNNSASPPPINEKHTHPSGLSPIRTAAHACTQISPVASWRSLIASRPLSPPYTQTQRSVRWGFISLGCSCVARCRLEKAQRPVSGRPGGHSQSKRTPAGNRQTPQPWLPGGKRGKKRSRSPAGPTAGWVWTATWHDTRPGQVAITRCTSACVGRGGCCGRSRSRV